MSRVTAIAAAALFLCSAAMADEPAPQTCPDGAGPMVWYLDADNDGFGDAQSFVIACQAPEGFVGNGDDLHDGNPDVLDG